MADKKLSPQDFETKDPYDEIGKLEIEINNLQAKHTAYRTAVGELITVCNSEFEQLDLDNPDEYELKNSVEYIKIKLAAVEKLHEVQ